MVDRIDYDPEQPKPRRKRNKDGSKKWGNTNQARGKIRRWAKEQAKLSGLPSSKQWRSLEIFQLSHDEVAELEEQWLAGEVKLGDNVVEQFSRDNPEIFRYEFDIKWRPETQDDPLIAYNAKADFLITDLFTARGKEWHQIDRGEHILGYSDEFDYFVFDIESGLPA